MTHNETLPGISINQMHKGDAIIFGFVENLSAGERFGEGTMRVMGHALGKDGKRKPVVDIFTEYKARMSDEIYHRDLGGLVLLHGAYDPDTLRLEQYIKPGSQLEFTAQEDVSGSFDGGKRPTLSLPLVKVRHPDNIWWISA